MSIKTQQITQNAYHTSHSFFYQDIENENFSNKLEIAAKKLSSEHDLDMYYKPRSNVNFCNHAVAVVAATAAIVAAASSVIAASSRGRTLDTTPIELQHTQVSGLNVNQLMEIRNGSL